MGRLFVGSCQSQAFEAQNEVSVQRIKEKELESDDDDDSSSNEQETNDEQELQDSGRSVPKQRLENCRCVNININKNVNISITTYNCDFSLMLLFFIPCFSKS